MSRFSLFDNQRKSEDYQFMDGIISEYFEMSGPSIFIHKYIGVYGADVDEDGNPVTSSSNTSATSASAQIQDVVLMENRDRQYDPVVKELHGLFQIPDPESSLSQFGFLWNNDSLFIEVHINDMLAAIGRKIIAGDVIELPNFRDDALLGEPNKAANKFYQVTEGKRAPNGYQATWMPHIWRIKCDPMTASQEFQDILSAPTQNPFGIDTGILGDIISNTAAVLNVNEQIVQQAEDEFLRRNFETRQLYIVPGDPEQSAWIFTGDGDPPNGAVLTGSGGYWPDQAEDGDYFLRTDHRPHTLYLYKDRAWRVQEIDLRQTWTAAGRLMMEFLNNRETATFLDGTTQPSKQNLYQAVKPSADF